MGMYTELQFNTKIKNDIPEKVLNVLNYFGDNTKEVPTSLPDHYFFSNHLRWHQFGKMSSAYFDAEPHCVFKQIYGDKAPYSFNMIFNLKNYGNEINLFLDWISPYIYSTTGNEYLGYYRYEEEEYPTSIYLRKHKIKLMRAWAPENIKELERGIIDLFQLGEV